MSRGTSSVSSLTKVQNCSCLGPAFRKSLCALGWERLGEDGQWVSLREIPAVGALVPEDGVGNRL